MTNPRKKIFDAQGIRSFEYVRPHAVLPFNPRVEEKFIDEEFYFIDEGPHFIDEESFFIDEKFYFIDEESFFIDEELYFIDEKFYFIDEEFYFIDARGRAFTAEWEKGSVTFPWQGAETQTFNINL